MDKKRKLRVFVAIPTMGVVADLLPHRLRQWEEQYKDEIQFVYPEHVVRRMFHDFARNALCQEFLDSGCDIMWFIDSDVVPAPNSIDLLTKHLDKWEAAGCPYPVWMSRKEDDNISQVIYTIYDYIEGKGLSPADIPKEGTAFVGGVATGCMLLKRSVFEKLEMPYFEFKYDEKTRDLTLGEDLGFCLKLLKQDIKFFTDFSMICQHFKNVDLLSVNNYAITYGNKSVITYDKMVKDQVAAAVKAAYKTGFEAGLQHKQKSQLIMPKDFLAK